MKTAVYQSYRTDDVPLWIEACLESVRAWAGRWGFDYRFYGDEIFERVPRWYREKTAAYPQIATDLGRIELARELLEEGYERVVWLDADVLIFDPARFVLSVENEFAFGREIWVQPDKGGRLKAYRNVHNAVSVYCRANTFLDFYAATCLRIIERADGGLPPQIVGTKLLTALHNIAVFGLVEDVQMASPLVLRDLAAGGGEALDFLVRETGAPPKAFNLCASLAGKVSDGVEVSPALLEAATDGLLAGRLGFAGD